VLPSFRLHRPFREKVNGKALCAAKSPRSGLLSFKIKLNPSIQRSERFSIAAQESQSGFSDLGKGSAAIGNGWGNKISHSIKFFHECQRTVHPERKKGFSRRPQSRGGYSAIRIDPRVR